MSISLLVCLASGAAGGAAVAILLYVFRTLGEGKSVTVTRSAAAAQPLPGTMSEGLFLLDRELTIGAGHSPVLADILHRNDLAGLKLPELLRDLVPGKTFAIASDFIKLLWTDRMATDAIGDVNPLREVEVHFTTPGGYETRYLEFRFKRIDSGTELSHILVSVSDITAQVRVRMKLEQTQAVAAAQMDLLLAIVHVTPEGLYEFLNGAEASLKQANAILMQPAASDGQFKEKIAQLFRAVHGVKSDAASLGLSTIEAKAQAFEEELSQLRAFPELTGLDLLDLPIQLDDLLSHFAAVRALTDRAAQLRDAFEGGKRNTSRPPVRRTPAQLEPQPTPGSPPSFEDTQEVEITQQLPPPDPLEQAVASLVERIASDLGKQVRVKTSGLELLPDSYRTEVRDIVLQLVRNAIVHGIETPEARTRANKDPLGRISVTVVAEHTKGTYYVTVEDDGRGLSSNRILTAALRQGLISPDEAKTLKGMDAMQLIFRPGFTTAKSVTRHAGRGVGMDFVKTKVEGLGGRIGIGGERGRRTLFRVSLPMKPRVAA